LEPGFFFVCKKELLADLGGENENAIGKWGKMLPNGGKMCASVFGSCILPECHEQKEEKI
jgi:hypothetical protein